MAFRVAAAVAHGATAGQPREKMTLLPLSGTSLAAPAQSLCPSLRPQKPERALTRCIPMEVAIAVSISVPTSSMKGYSSCRWTITLAPEEDTRKGLYSSSLMYRMTCRPGQRGQPAAVRG